MVKLTTLLILPPLSLINWLLHACPPSIQLSHLVIRAPHLHDRFVSVRHAHSPARPAKRDSMIGCVTHVQSRNLQKTYLGAPMQRNLVDY